ncbi:MAG: hypothetical protein EOO88_24820 [Pedobacter sp.]|nr:MAG: hypothetical protein EOO88_24820 [Pedobacter sp.]
MDCADSSFSFELNVIAFPALDSIQSGDTIWLEVNSPVQFIDRNTGIVVDYSGAKNLGSAIGFQKLSAENMFDIAAVRNFRYTIRKGTEITSRNAELYKEYNFAESGGKYTFLLGVTPTETGTFRLVFSNAGNVVRRNDNCTKAGFEIDFKDTHQHLYLDPNYVPGDSGGGAYYFKVVQ